MLMKRLSCALPLLAAFTVSAAAQTMSIEEYTPKSTLVVPQHIVTRAKYPFIDVHSHQSSSMTPDDVDQLVREMDAMNMAVMVNLSGGSGQRLKSGIASLKGRYPDRFVVFANVDFSGIGDPNWGSGRRPNWKRM